jgi:hypothetical protein
VSHFEQTSQALTKADYERIVAIRKRPVSWGPMRRARTPDDDSTSSPSLIDTYIQPKGTP